MPLNIGTSEKREYTPVPAGTHLALWAGIVDLGPQDSRPGPFPKPPQHQVCVIFEIPGETVDVNGEQKPARKYNVLTASMESRANLRKWVEATAGKMDDGTAGTFDLFSLVGKPCLLTIEHKVSKANGKTYDNVSAVAPLMKGMTAPELSSDPIIYGGDQTDTFNELPAWLQQKIQSALPMDVYQAKRKQFFDAKRAAEEAKKQDGPPPDDPDDPGPSDDVPF